MATVRTLRARTSMLTLLPHATFTFAQLQVDPLGAPYAPQFDVLRTEGKQVLLLELGYLEDIAAAQARAVAADSGLDGFASRFSKAILTLTGDERSHALYAHYFEKPLAALTRPVLNGQLQAMKKWRTSLAKTPHPTLSAMLPELEALLAEADAAVAARDSARQANREFRDVGERRQWLDRLNATRKAVYGSLAKLPHEHPGLPSDFADKFFMAGPVREDDDEADTVEGLLARAEALREELAEVEARLAEEEAVEAAAQRRKEIELRAAQQAALAEMDRAAAELEQKRAALRAELAASPR